ncbi:FAD:protein FMN transferase [Prevotella sp. 10(H)]|uniref:FAD:protein FMN transferase n=1 Tax=Prevotella sp. 10(H) TaxID=1158294 RepID=UPI0004A6F070|nr:FAD:protein FMN transferase [Prevotella sp. 10(H)]
MNTTSSHFDFYESSNLFHGSMMHAMGTRLDVIIVGPDKNASLICWEKIEKEVLRLSKLFNKFDEKSELYAVNRKSAESPFRVSDELWRVLADCKQYHSMTSGYFDISMKDYSQVVLDGKKQTVYFNDKEIELDLGAYAKGYALEKIREILISKNVECALINFGNSSVLAIGSHPHGEYWPIGIEDPYNPQNTLGIIELKDNTMSTSGNMPSHTKHIVDPHTGISNESRKIVSVKTANAIDAEVLSTTLMIIPDELVSSVLSNFIVDEYLSFDLE